MMSHSVSVSIPTQTSMSSWYKMEKIDFDREAFSDNRGVAAWTRVHMSMFHDANVTICIFGSHVVSHRHRRFVLVCCSIFMLNRMINIDD